VHAVQLDAGDTHTCAVTATSTLKCWGGNGSGQLGLGNTNSIGDGGSEMGSSLAAIDLGSGRTVQSVSAGGNHTCAIVDAGDIKCWGSNSSGQLGIRSTATAIGDGSGEMGSSLTTTFVGPAIQVATGREHTCALFFDGTVKCWGDNQYGQLGRANTTDVGRTSLSMGIYLSAINLGSGRTATQISTGDDHTCALLDDGTVKCWGLNGSGQLGRSDKFNYGDSSSETISAMSAISFGSRRVVSISTGAAHSCAYFGDGSSRCWGENSDGQLGRDTTLDYGVLSTQLMSSLAAITIQETSAPTGAFAAHPSPYGLRTVVFDFDLAETATGITSADFTTSGTATGCVVTATPTSTTYVIVQVDCFSDGTVTVTLGTSTMTDASGNTGPSSAISSNAVTMDMTSPTATLTAPASPTGSTALSYNLAFNEDVTGLTAADFTATGTASPCTITPVANSASSYRIDLSCTSTGTVGLSMRTSAVSDGAGNSGPGTTTSASSVTIDSSLPSASWSTSATSGTSRTVVFDLTFSESVTGLSTTDITRSGTASCGTPTIAGSGVSFTVTYTCTTDGTVIPTLLAGSVTDSSTNSGPATAVTATDYTIDGTAPTANWTSPSSPTNSLTPSFDLVFDEAVSNLIASDVTVVSGAGTASCSVSGITGSGAEYTVSTTCSGEGTLTLRLSASSVSDAAGNT
jgi:hypothetical protein